MQGTQSPPPSEDLKHLLALLSINGIGSATASRLINTFGSAKSIFDLPANVLEKHRLKNSTISDIQNFCFSQIEPTLAWLEAPDHHLITAESPFYPTLLAQIPNPPMALFAVGNIELLATPQIAVIGTRKPSASGMGMAHDFSQHLCEAGYTITSGLAVGVDGESHRAALKSGGNTIAVMGTGPDRIYPAHHRELAHQIADKGLLLTERLPGTKFDTGAFPQRNRIIAGLSLGTLVVEAAKKSGTLITANLAADYGREVFAIPGSIHNPLSHGCHHLIKQGAKLVESCEDILEDLPHFKLSAAPTIHKHDQRPELSVEDHAFLNHVDFDITSVDTIVARSQLTVDAVTNKLLALELQGWILNSAGGYIRQ